MSSFRTLGKFSDHSGLGSSIDWILRLWTFGILTGSKFSFLETNELMMID